MVNRNQMYGYILHNKGLLTNTPSGRTNIDHDNDTTTTAIDDDDSPETSKEVQDLTDTRGIAKVIYNAGDSTSAEVVASISVIDENNRVIDLQDVIFSIRGGPSRTPDDTPDEDDEEDEEDEEDDTTVTGNPISFSPAQGLTGAPGAVVTLRVAAGTATVIVTGDNAFNVEGGSISGTSTDRSVTLPTVESLYTLTLTAPGYTPTRVLVTVSGTATPGAGTGAGTATGTLSIALAGARSGNQQGFRCQRSLPRAAIGCHTLRCHESSNGHNPCGWEFRDTGRDVTHHDRCSHGDCQCYGIWYRFGYSPCDRKPTATTGAATATATCWTGESRPSRE